MAIAQSLKAEVNEGALRNGRYQLHEKLGSGSMADIFRALGN